MSSNLLRNIRNNCSLEADIVDSSEIIRDQEVKTLIWSEKSVHISLVLLPFCHCDSRALKLAFGPDVKLVHRTKATEVSGFPVGSIPPVGHDTTMPVFVDMQVLYHLQRSSRRRGCASECLLYGGGGEPNRSLCVSLCAFLDQPHVQVAEFACPCVEWTDEDMSLPESIIRTVKFHIPANRPGVSRLTATIPAIAEAPVCADYIPTASTLNEMHKLMYKDKPGFADALRRTLQAGRLDPKERCSSGKAALHLAAWRGTVTAIDLLLTYGCDVNSWSTGEGNYGKTPIFYAITRNRDGIVEHLLQRGALVSFVNNKGQTPVSLAYSHLSERTQRLLEDAELRERESGIVWRDFYASNWDGCQYGDLDPRFMTPAPFDPATELIPMLEPPPHDFSMRRYRVVRVDGTVDETACSTCSPDIDINGCVLLPRCVMPSTAESRAEKSKQRALLRAAAKADTTATSPPSCIPTCTVAKPATIVSTSTNLQSIPWAGEGVVTSVRVKHTGEVLLKVSPVPLSLSSADDQTAPFVRHLHHISLPLSEEHEALVTSAAYVEVSMHEKDCSVHLLPEGNCSDSHPVTVGFADCSFAVGQWVGVMGTITAVHVLHPEISPVSVIDQHSFQIDTTSVGADQRGAAAVVPLGGQSVPVCRVSVAAEVIRATPVTLRPDPLVAPDTALTSSLEAALAFGRSVHFSSCPVVENTESVDGNTPFLTIPLLRSSYEQIRGISSTDVSATLMLPMLVHDAESILALEAALRQECDRRQCILGLDAEWKPELRHEADMDSYSEDFNAVTVLQLATRDFTCVIDMQNLSASAARLPLLDRLDKLLSPIFASEEVLLVGWGVQHDLLRLERSFPHMGCFCNSYRFLDLQVFVGMDSFAQIRNLVAPAGGSAARRLSKGSRIGLGTVCTALIGYRLNKAQQLSAWDRRPLTPAQLEYAALDAAVIPVLFDILCAILTRPDMETI